MAPLEQKAACDSTGQSLLAREGDESVVEATLNRGVIPAKAVISEPETEIPAFAGMTLWLEMRAERSAAYLIL
jgi:hypothetical protein